MRDRVRAVAVAGRRAMFACARDDGNVGVFDLASPTSLVHRFSASDPAEHMAFSRDGYLLAVAFAARQLAVYQVLTGDQLLDEARLAAQPMSITFDADDHLVGYGQADGRLVGWNLQHNLVGQPHP